jgi:hypothetical protein
MTDEIDFLAAEAERQGATGAAAFLAMLADAMKALAADAKTAAVLIAQKQHVEKVTGKHEGVTLGVLRKNDDKIEWEAIPGNGIMGPPTMEPGGELYEWVEKHHPSWIDVHSEVEIPETVIPGKIIPERRVVSHARMVELCETLGDDGTDPGTGTKVPGIRSIPKIGSWVLTKDKAAKALVARAVRAMVDQGLPIGPREIEGGK